MKTDPNHLPNDIEQLKTLLLASRKKINDLENQTAHWQLKYESLLESFKLAQQHRYGASSEKNPLQDELFDEADAPISSEDSTQETVNVVAHAREKRHPKRTPLPAHFPREEIVVDVDAAEKVCACGCQKERFGETVSEQLDVVPPQLKVLRYVRPKYVCKACEGSISIAPLPALLLPKSMVSASFVAYTITAKYNDHIPLYRQEKIWARYGVMIPRNSSCDWLMKTAELCEPLWLLLGSHIRLGNYTQADETTLQVLPGAKEVSNRKKHYMWVYRGGPPNQIATVFDYQMTRSGQHARDFLSGFNGYLQTDGYAGYDWVDDDPDIVHLACMAHARRPFAELVKLAKKTGKAHQAIAYIKKLYRVEDRARVESLSPESRYKLRLKESKPILDTIHAWLEKSLSGTPPQSKLGKAIRYMLERWGALTNYLKDGRLEIDNNLAENAIRPFTLGRKNWMFAGSARGAKAGAIFYSLIKTAQDNGLEAYHYLRYLLTNIPSCKTDEEYQALLPWNIPAEKLKVEN